MVITSQSNEQIKHIINLNKKSSYRKQNRQFIAEGVKMFREAPKEDIVKVYVSDTFSAQNDKLLENTDFQIVSDAVFNKISDTVTPQGILCIVKQRQYSLKNIVDTYDRHENDRIRFVILDRIQDPGNLGTIIRTAEGAGITAIITGNDTVDRYSPKVIRSTMGSIYRVPFITADSLPDVIDGLHEYGFTLYAAHLQGAGYYDDIAYSDRAAVMIGNESQGLSSDVSAKADKLVKIPMQGKIESLNAAVAAALFMYSMR